MSTLFDIWNTIQLQLFPWLEQELDPLSHKEREFVIVVSMLDLPSHMKEFRWQGFGRKKKSRINMAKVFVASSIYKLETTDILIEYLRNCKIFGGCAVGNSLAKYHPEQRSLGPLLFKFS